MSYQDGSVKPWILGFDFGGTKLTTGIIDISQRSILSHASCLTPKDAALSLAAITAQGQNLLDAASVDLVRGIAVSFGGPVCADQRTVHASHHVPGWQGFPLAEALETKFKLPAIVANDADAAALGEYCFGAGQGVKYLLYLTVSTGIGGGIIVEGAIYHGEHAWAGEIGHMTLQPDGPLCPCGRRGCLEALASGRSIARAMAQRLSEGAPSSLSGGEISAQKVALAAAAGDHTAIQVWSEAMRWLGIGIANAAHLLDPGRVVIGGGLSRAGALLFGPAREAAALYALDRRIEIVPAELGDHANLLGAAALLAQLKI
jgi:glucokinase